MIRKINLYFIQSGNAITLFSKEFETLDNYPIQIEVGEIIINFCVQQSKADRLVFLENGH